MGYIQAKDWVEYSPPLGETKVQRRDVYAFAATFYKMLTGMPPRNASDILNEGFNRQPLVSYGISDDVISLIETGLSPMKRNRPQSVDDFLNRINPHYSEHRKEPRVQLPPIPKDGQQNLANAGASVAIPGQWASVDSFSEGLARVRDGNRKYGYIDEKGNLVIPCNWKSAGPFSEGLAVVVDANKKYGFIDKTGKLVIPCQWEDAMNFHLGRAGVKDKNGKWGCIDKTGKVVK